ncbi:MAG: hypothetical protein K6G03_12070 [Lachnospiraceae bacterium]|nr:hypothetical protein [Lachnospiraceae bacterium]
MSKYKTEKGDFSVLGPQKDGNDVIITVVSDKPTIPAVELYAKNGKRKGMIHFSKEHRMGSVYSMRIKDVNAKDTVYRIRMGKSEYIDPNVKTVVGNRRFGKRDGFGGFDTPHNASKLRGPRIDWENVILYLLNVRAYTKDSSSGVKHPGTFDGLSEKISYIKKLGVTSVLLQPSYDFNEVNEASIDGVRRNNLWGYVPGNYYVPKPAYAFGDPAEEFMHLVDELHKNKLELIMQIYFLPEHSPRFIEDVLRYWVHTYNVDGFEILGADLPVKQIAGDPYLTDTKIIFNDIDPDTVYGRKTPVSMNMGIMSSPFMYDMRKYLKGDEDMLGKVTKHLLMNPEKNAVINYITSYSGFTLKDLVSYERKHNEKNGEGGTDGSDYNYSWNCGDEGTSRRKAVNRLRERQMRNALMLLMLSQGVPMLRAGDEFANTQRGNNNPWCQDNKISYLDWNDKDKNKELYAYTKSLIGLRKAHPVLHGRYAKKMYDYISCGSPDVSFHGEQAWNQNFANYNRHFAVMYSGSYERIANGRTDNDFYVAYNMHWTGHRFHPPKPLKGKKWVICFSSGEDRESGIYDAEKNELAVYQRSIVVLMTEDDITVDAKVSDEKTSNAKASNAKVSGNRISDTKASNEQTLNAKASKDKLQGAKASNVKAVKMKALNAKKTAVVKGKTK